MAGQEDILINMGGFDRDKGNILKNWERHNVSHIECEEVFFNMPLLVKNDTAHSATEERYYVLGKTDGGWLLFMVFTIRKNKIRIISARDTNRKERKAYEESEKNS